MNLVSGFIVLLGLGVTMAQRRSPYAPRPFTYPHVINRFLTESDNSSTPNRFGEGETPKDNSIPELTPHGEDPDLVKIVESWPRERQPYWYINSKAIADHRNNEQPHNDNRNAQQSSQASEESLS